MTSEWGPMTSRTIDLGHEQLLLLEGRPGTRVKVIYGGVWLTEEGDRRDVFALSGDEVAVRAHRQSLLEGLGATRVEIHEPVARHRIRDLRRRFGAAAVRAARHTRSWLPSPKWSPHVPRAMLAAVVGVAIPTLVAVGIAAAAPILGQFV